MLHSQSVGGLTRFVTYLAGVADLSQEAGARDLGWLGTSDVHARTTNICIGNVEILNADTSSSCIGSESGSDPAGRPGYVAAMASFMIEPMHPIQVSLLCLDVAAFS